LKGSLWYALVAYNKYAVDAPKHSVVYVLCGPWLVDYSKLPGRKTKEWSRVRVSRRPSVLRLSIALAVVRRSGRQADVRVDTTTRL
jgi:hypothetical protein